MAKDRITIWGTSFKKIADEAQLLAHYKIITSHDPDQKITFITSPRTEISKNYPQIKITPFSRPLAAIRALASSKLLVIGGGPFFDDPAQLLKTGILISLAKLLRIPILVYGVTVFPIQTWWGKLGYRTLLSKADSIHVRDRAANESLIDIGLPQECIQVGIDLRYVLDSAKPDKAERLLRREGVDPERPVICLSTRYFDSHLPAWVKNTHGFDDRKAANASRAFARAINDLSPYGQLVLIPMHPEMEEDLETADIIRSHMQDPDKLIVLKKRYQINEILGIIQAAQLFVTARVGSILFSSIAATPVLAVAYDERTTELMGELGMQKYAFDWRILERESIVAGAKELLQNHGKISEALRERAKELRLRATQDSQLYKRYLQM